MGADACLYVYVLTHLCVGACVLVCVCGLVRVSAFVGECVWMRGCECVCGAFEFVYLRVFACVGACVGACV